MSNEAQAEQARKDAAVSKLQRCVSELHSTIFERNRVRNTYGLRSPLANVWDVRYEAAVKAKDLAMKELEASTASFVPTDEQADKVLDAAAVFPARDDLSQELAEPTPNPDQGGKVWANLDEPE
jgi:hypothetical protein